MPAQAGAETTIEMIHLPPADDGISPALAEMSRTATLLFNNNNVNRFSRDCLCPMNVKSRESLHRLSSRSSQSSLMDVSLRSSANDGGLEEIEEFTPW
jgi:hypothetical protein